MLMGMLIGGLVAGLGVGLAVGFTASLAPWLASGLEIGLASGLAVGLAVGTGVSMSQTAWPSYLLERVWLVLNQRLPWSLMSFLADAHRRGVLRQAGEVYQFRHIELQHRLATRPELADAGRHVGCQPLSEQRLATGRGNTRTPA
jgi:hypothetical protein